MKTTAKLFSNSPFCPVRVVRSGACCPSQAARSERAGEDDPRDVGLQGDAQREQRHADCHEDDPEGAHSLLVSDDS